MIWETGRERSKEDDRQGERAREIMGRDQYRAIQGRVGAGRQKAIETHI